MSSPYENIPYADGNAVTIQPPSSSGFSGRDLGVWIKDTVNGSHLFKSSGQSDGQQTSSEGTQSMNGQNNVSEIVSGAPQLAANTAVPSGDETDEKTGLSLEDASMDIDYSNLEPDWEALFEPGNFNRLQEHIQANAESFGYTSHASVSSHVTPSQAQGSVACMDQSMSPQGMSAQGSSAPGMAPHSMAPQDMSTLGMSSQGMSAQGSSAQAHGKSPKHTSPLSMAPQDMSTLGMSPQGTSPQGSSSKHTSPDSMAPQGMSAQAQGKSPKHTSPQSMSPLGMSSQSMSPRGMAPHSMALQDMSPLGMSSQGMAPHSMAPRDMSTLGMSPQGMSPHSMAPRDMSTLGMSPQGMSPQGSSSKHTSPHSMAPQGSSAQAQGKSPKQTSPLDMSLLGMSPLGMSTLGMAPHNMAPQGMAPHNMAPQGMSTQGVPMQGSAMQGYYPNPNGTQWNPTYVAQGGPFYGHPSHHFSRGIYDGTSVYNSSESESPTGGARQREHAAGSLASSGGDHATGTLTGSTVGSSLGFGNPSPIILPGTNNELIRNPSSDSEYTPSAKVCKLLSSLDKKAPGFMPSMAEVYNAGSNGADTRTIFSDAQSAQKFIEKHDYHDDTIPRTLDQQKAIVKVLFKAMKNVDHAQDNKNMITPFINGKYSNERIEKVCWSIMQTCIYRHSHGSLLANYGIKSKQSSRIDTYAARMSKIIELLTLRKTICKHLLDPFFIYHVVDDPVHALKRVESNKTLNERKGTYMVRGKKAAEEEESAKKSPMPKPEKVITPPTVERLKNGKASSSNPDRTMTPQEAIEAQKKDTANSSATVGHSAHIGSGTNRKPSGLSQAESVSPSPAPKTQGACLDHAQKLNGSGPSCPQDKPAGNGISNHRDHSFEFGVTPSSDDGQTVVFNSNNNNNNNDNDNDNNNNQDLTGKSPLSSTASPIIGRKRGAPELDEATVPKKRHLSSGSAMSPSSENGQVAVLNNNNNHISNGQSQSLSTVSPSRKRGASEWDDEAVAKKRHS